MRGPSWLFLILAGVYLLPAIVLDIVLVCDMGNSYAVFDIIGMAVLSAPVGFVPVLLLERTIPLDWPAAWFAVLVVCQCGNVLLAWGVVRVLRLTIRAAARLVGGGNPPSPEEERMRPSS